MFHKFFMLSDVINFDNSVILLSVFLIILMFTCFKLIISTSMFENVILMSVFSMLISVVYLLMDAPDVAMTEVALGACLSTCVFLNFLKLSNSSYTKLKLVRLYSSIIICIILTAILSWASIDITQYGLVDSPIHQNVAKYYIENTMDDMGIPSPVAAILASYRGYDTLGETCVILIAGIAVLLILSLKTLKNKDFE